MGTRRLASYDVLVLVSGIWFLGKFVRYAFPPLFETIQSTYVVSNTVVGAAFTGFMLVYAAMQFPSGLVADRLGSVRVVVAGASIAALGAFALVVPAPFVVLVAAMLVIGFGTGLHKTVAVRLIARVYPARTGRALGVHDTLGAFGGVAAPTVVVLLLSGPPAVGWLLGWLPGSDWRVIFFLSALAFALLAAAFAHRFRGRLASEGDPDRGSDDASVRTDGTDGADNTHSEPQPHLREYVALFGVRRFSAFVLVTVGVSFAHNGAVAFLPLYLSSEFGVTTAVAGVLYSLFFWATFVQLATGDLSDRIGRLPVIASTAALGAVSLWGLVVFPSLSVFVLGGLIFTLGVGAHGFQPVRGAYLMELLPERLSGGGLGGVRTLLMGAGAVAPLVVGVLADVSTFRVAFGLLAASMAVSAIGAVGMWLTEPASKPAT